MDFTIYSEVAIIDEDVKRAVAAVVQALSFIHIYVVRMLSRIRR